MAQLDTLMIASQRIEGLEADYQQLLTVAKGLAEACEAAKDDLVDLINGDELATSADDQMAVDAVMRLRTALANFAQFDKPKDA